ncbi:MAG: hypothetical protein CSA74_07025 [Rhodobacterales bacterium]|nr:MAG: hypothetical protein CSA74_07025 [Rhodobacterales bacterium]
MKTYIRWSRIGAWALIGLVGVFILAKTYLGYHSGLPIGEAVKNTIADTLDFDEPKDIGVYIALVIGVGTLFRARVLSKALEPKDKSQ